MEQDKQPGSPFYSRPGLNENGDTPPTTYRAKEDPPNAFATAAKVLGIIALVSVFAFTVYPPLILGSLAIILALLSRGASFQFHTSAKIGIRTSLIALGIDIVLVAASFGLVYGNPEFLEELDDDFQEIYGMSYEEMMESIQDGTFDYEEYYENLFEYLSE